MVLRPVTLDDAGELALTVAAGFASYAEWAPPGWGPPPGVFEPPTIREGLARPSCWGLIAEDDGRVAGHVTITQARERAEPREDIPGLAHLWQLFVRPPWWGTGLATELLARALAEATRQGYTAMRLHTPYENKRARAFYEREGWGTDGIRIPDPMLGIDIIQYRRALG